MGKSVEDTILHTAKKMNHWYLILLFLKTVYKETKTIKEVLQV